MLAAGIRPALAAALFPLVVAWGCVLPSGSAAEGEGSGFRHGLSAFGDLGYPPEFEHFSYVNPDAPKGGTFSTFDIGTFDSLHNYVRKGDRAWADALPLLHDTLMTRAADEPDAMYGLLASGARVADDGTWVEFKLRPEARFEDGSPVTAEDVVFSFESLRTKGRPIWLQRYAGVESAQIVQPDVVRFRFRADVPLRDLPLQVADLPVLQASWWEGREFADSTLDAPAGSGPYRVAEVDPGRRIVFERRPDYWGRDLPVNRGRFNFDRLIAEYFRDHTAAFEGFKAGVYLFKEEYVSSIWMTQYNFPDAERGLVLKDLVPDLRPSGTQGFWINTRQERFQDVRVREALGLAFDFEWSNETLFHGQYLRTDSFFEGSPLAAEGAASEEERALLASAGAALPEEQLEAPYSPPATDGSGRIRSRIREAGELLDAAGWSIGEGGLRRNASGEVLVVEFLNDSPWFERIIQPYVKNLQQLGIDASMLSVDSAQEEIRRKSFDYDIIAARFSLAPTPGVEVGAFFRSSSADQEGSFNLSGIRDPAIDRLVDAVGDASTRAEHSVAVSALDRALRAGHYWVPHWNLPAHRIAFWDVFGRPESKPPFDPAFIDTWWADPEPRAEVLERLGGGG